MTVESHSISLSRSAFVSKAILSISISIGVEAAIEIDTLIVSSAC